MAQRKRGVPGSVVAGPLAPFAEDYEAKLRTRGYSSRSVVCELNHLARLSRWMEERRLLAEDMSRQRSAATPRRRSGLFAESPGPGVGSPRRAWGRTRLG